MSLGEHESHKGIHRLFACLCVAVVLPQLPEGHTSLIISESCLLFSHSFRNSSQFMELVRNTGPVFSAEWEGARGRLLPLSGCSSTSATHQLVDSAEWKHAGEIMSSFREIARSRPCLRRADARVDT
jgi:hypothetical protein